MCKLLALILSPLVILAGCGGGGSQIIATPGPPNVEGLIVDAGPTGLTTAAVNTAFIKVQLCVPGTNTCQTIDHIEVDTGSSGLRILADAATSTGPYNLNLPPSSDSNNHPLAECLRFVDGTSWGSLNFADVRLPTSGESVSHVTVHVIGAGSVGSPPADCTGSPENTVNQFGANGILGVGPFINDCDSVGPCSPQTPALSATYYSCPNATTCATTTVSQAQQVPNPVSLFAKDNNGVIIELPPVPASGAAAPLNGGAVVFGIGTEANNAMTGATKLPMCPGTPQAGCQQAGTIGATLNGTMYPNSYLDSGSNANFFPGSLTVCPGANSGFYCPNPSPVNESVTLQATNGTLLAADFSVADAGPLFMNLTYAAFSNLGGPATDNTSVDLGLSFFYGRNVFTGFEDTATNAAPYFAY